MTKPIASYFPPVTQEKVTVEEVSPARVFVEMTPEQAKALADLVGVSAAPTVDGWGDLYEALRDVTDGKDLEPLEPRTSKYSSSIKYLILLPRNTVKLGGQP